MSPQQMVPELTDEEWAAYCASPDRVLPCPVCGVAAHCALKQGQESVRWSGCGHVAFTPESPLTWPADT